MSTTTLVQIYHSLNLFREHYHLYKIMVWLVKIRQIQPSLHPCNHQLKVCSMYTCIVGNYQYKIITFITEKQKHLHGRYGECENCLRPDYGQCVKYLDKKKLVVLGGKRKLVSTENALELRMSTMSSNQRTVQVSALYMYITICSFVICIGHKQKYFHLCLT